MATRQLTSSDVYNARRKGKRYIASLEKLRRRQKGAERRATTNLIKDLRRAVKDSYLGRGATQEEMAESFKRLKSLTPSKTQRSDLKRANFVMEKEISRASSLIPSTLGDANLDRAKGMVKIFYSATQRYWEGREGNRNELIMKGLGFDNLRDAFKYVMSMNPKAIDELEKSLAEVDSTSDIPFFEDYDFSETIGSPPYLNHVEMV